MVSQRLLIVLLIGTAVMCLSIICQMKSYHIRLWKSAIVSVSIIFTGLIGSELLFFAENGYWGGKSFFGAIFLSPLTFALVSRLLRIPYLHSLDLCSTAGCLMLAILKVQCIMDGCCQGIILYVNRQEIYVRFPSQIIEFVVAILLFFVLLLLSYHAPCRGLLYPLTLIMYGGTRFSLNLFRDDWDRMREMHLPIPIGNIWSLLAIAVGTVWFIVLGKQKKKYAIDQILGQDEFF